MNRDPQIVPGRLLLAALWLAVCGTAWMQVPWGGEPSWILTHPGQGKVQQTRLALAISTTMKGFIPEASERQVIYDWIARRGQRDLFYGRVWPILKRRCHRCHGELHRAKGAMALTRLSHVLPLIRQQGPVRGLLWSAFLRTLPLVGGLLWILGLLLASGDGAGRAQKWMLFALFGCLLLHVAGLILALNSPWGMALAAYAPLLYAALATGCCLSLLRASQPPK